MEVLIYPNKNDASKVGAQIIANQISKKSDSVLGLATGGTPNEMYKELIELHKSKNLSFSKVSSFNLDEYVGVEASNNLSYRNVINSALLNHIDIDLKNTFVPDGNSSNIPDHCTEYEAQIFRRGGIDLQILGIGSNGHIGFNEPSSSLASRTRIKTLTQKTIQANKLDPSIKHCITMGIGTILEAKHCLLLAFGESKAQAVADFIEGPVRAMVPASALQMHKHVTVLLDEAAASKLKNKNYYTEVFNNKPDWQGF